MLAYQSDGYQIVIDANIRSYPHSGIQASGGEYPSNAAEDGGRHQDRTARCVSAPSHHAETLAETVGELARKLLGCIAGALHAIADRWLI